MTALFVMPVMDPQRARTSIESLDKTVRDTSLIVIDNGLIGRSHLPTCWSYMNFGGNLGVSASWNVGRAFAVEYGYDWLVICSEAVRFRDGGRDWLTNLEACETPLLASLYSFHLIGIRTEVLVKVGAFDEQWHSYVEDCDMLRRFKLAGYGEEAWTQDHNTAQTVDDRVVAGTITDGLAYVEFGPAHSQFIRKWGGPPNYEEWEHPYNRQDLDYRYVGLPVDTTTSST